MNRFWIFLVHFSCNDPVITPVLDNLSETQFQNLTYSDSNCWTIQENFRNGTKISDQVSIKSMLEKFNLLSVNQLAAQIKLKEVWKSLNCENYPIKLEIYNNALKDGSHTLRHKENRIFKDTCRLQKSKISFNLDAARLWNAAPLSIKNSVTSYEAKKSSLIFVKYLPL